MARLACLLAGVALSCPISACSTASGSHNAGPDGDPQSVCGRTSELRDVELYTGSFGLPTRFVARHRLAVGLLRWKSDLDERYLEQAGNVKGQGWCSGTLIADDLFLTAGHCLDPADSGSWRLPREKDGLELRPAELARQFTVQFRFEARALPDAPSYVNDAEVLRLEEYRNEGVDYAILRLNGHPGSLNRVARISAFDAKAGSSIAILQHPGAEWMKVGAGPVTRVVGRNITYDTIDTLGGSSGAGLLDAITGKLVGIHTNGGCRSSGGENYGVTIRALTLASPIVQGLVDRSRDFLVGDWNADGHSDLAVFADGCWYPDTDHDGAPDPGLRLCPSDPNADQYFAWSFQRGGPDQLAWRRGDCVYFDVDPERPLCFDAPFEVLITDWNGDGRSDLGIRSGPCIAFDTDLDGALDERGYCYGNGVAEDEYLVGHWHGATRASIAVRRGNTLLIDVDRDGDPDGEPHVFGTGGDEDQYLVGDWDGDGADELAIRRSTDCINEIPNQDRTYRDFWSTP